MRADNSRHIVAAARKRSAVTRDKAIRALRRLDVTGRPVTIEALAREAGVSRSWLYGQADLRAEIERLRGRTRPGVIPVPARQQASDASLRRRLEAANQRLCALATENHELREQLAAALGEMRSLRLAGSKAVPPGSTMGT